jgi:hypothetical protein
LHLRDKSCRRRAIAGELNLTRGVAPSTRRQSGLSGENRIAAQRGLTSKKIPHHTDANAYDIVYFLKHPAKLAQERTAIRDALKNVRFGGVTGDNTCFDPERDAQLPGFVIEIKDLKWNLFDSWPADPCK